MKTMKSITKLYKKKDCPISLSLEQFRARKRHCHAAHLHMNHWKWQGLQAIHSVDKPVTLASLTGLQCGQVHLLFLWERANYAPLQSRHYCTNQYQTLNEKLRQRDEEIANISLQRFHSIVFP